MEHKILVPIDFTETSDSAINSAINIAKQNNSILYLLHILQNKKTVFFLGKNNDVETQIIEAGTLSRLQKISNNILEEHNIKTEIIAVHGNIFETINDVADEVKADYIVMGTHGVSGMQHLTGSNALKVIYSSSIPFIIVQKPEKEKVNDFSDIVFPIDYQKESKNKALRAVYFAKEFNAKVNVIFPKETDRLLVQKVKANLRYVKGVFDKNNIDYSISEFEKNGRDIAEATNDFAKKINAGLIMIMIYPNKGAGEFFITPDQQKVISNPSCIPVICINARDIYLA